MYELIVLSLLMRWPMHGYIMVKVTNDIIGPWARISSGTLSTIMKRMEQTGLIVALPQKHDSAHRARTFTITDEGRKRFHRLMMDTSSNLGDYQKIFRYKMGFFDLLHPEERLLLMNHYINYCQATILHLQSEMGSLVYELSAHPAPAFLENVLRGMKHIVQQWQAECDWIIGVRDQELERINAADSSDTQEERA